MRNRGVFFLLLNNVIQAYDGSNKINHLQKLYKDIFANYTKTVMPLPDYSSPLKVSLRFQLGSVISFKEVEETISLSASINVNWTDTSLSWEPALYGHINFILLDSTEIWTPSLVMTNSVANMKPFGTDSRLNAFLMYDGQIFYTPGDVFEAKCPTDVSKFPFDEQSCTFSIVAWGMPRSVLTLETGQKEASLQYFTPHSDWTLISYSTEVIFFGTEELPVYVLELKMKRSSLYYGVMIITPTMMFSLLNPLVFILPVDSGERVGLAMTILLAYAIFLTLVAASTPASSNPMCSLLILMVIIIIISGMIVVGVIISVMYYNKTDVNNKGSCIKCMTMCNKKRYNEYAADNETKLTGKDIADKLDSVFLFTSYTLIILITVGYIIYLNI